MTCTVEPPIKGHNRKQRTIKVNVNFFIVQIIIFYEEQPLNKEQNGQKAMGPKRVRHSEVPLYTHLSGVSHSAKSVW